MSLYNNAHTTMGFEITPNGMTLEHAKMIVDEGNLNFNWLNGRAMKINLHPDIIDVKEYDSERNYEHKKLGFSVPKTAKEIIENMD